MKALMVVDMQNDFCTGTLPVPGALEIVGGIIERMNEYRKMGLPIALSACRHPIDHCSFKSEGGQWPTHCVALTEGARLHLAIRLMWRRIRKSGRPEAFIAYKGQYRDKEEYSAFANPALRNWLSNRQIKELEICGLARDYCVEATRRDAEDFEIKGNVNEALTRAVNSNWNKDHPAWLAASGHAV